MNYIYSCEKLDKNCCHQSCRFLLKYTPNHLSAGALLQPHWGSLQRSPRPLAVFRGLLLREGREEEGRSRAEERTGGIGREERVGEGGESRKWVGKEGEGPHDPLAWGLPMS